MYSARFISDSGNSYLFGSKGQTAFQMDVGTGIPVDLKLSQGFAQVGESVNTQSVSGKIINVVGAVYGNVEKKKNELRKVFAPFSSGKLIFNETHYIRVYVKNSPNFSAVKNHGKFTMTLYAPYPFFRNVKPSLQKIGELVPMFTFPVNYAIPHKFGEKGLERHSKIVNGGDVPVPYDITIVATVSVQNPVITNLLTGEKMKINGSLDGGDALHIFRNKHGIFQAELIKDNVINDVISWVDEESNFFELPVGDSVISVIDDQGGGSLETTLVFEEAVVSVYES